MDVLKCACGHSKNSRYVKREKINHVFDQLYRCVKTESEWVCWPERVSFLIWNEGYVWIYEISLKSYLEWYEIVFA